MKITYKEIAEMTNKTEAGIKKMKSNNPEQLEIIKLGALCKKFNITVDDLEQLIKLKTNI